ncbi:WD repeat-containing protein 19 [Geranomyces variabilis]|uniref:WD repeat-containing protein 19 n=1 Tax=Geranomyces variabilis TaxID=109894 RepID=A0AAD5TMS2_9FUNG|nr:WD repeat-containing protein 19 [Geranomyces variabilis]
MKSVFSIPAAQLGHGAPRFDWQKKSSSFLAAVGTANVVHVYDRHGQSVDSFPLTGECTGLEWSPDGDVLAVIQTKSGIVVFWSAATRRVDEHLDSGMKHLHFLRWSPKGDFLAVGTSKGNLFLYDRKEAKKTPVLGKHSKAIVTGCWSWDNILACASDDKTFTLSTTTGDTIISMALSGEPSLMQWANMKNAHGVLDPVLSVILSGKSLFIYNINHPEAPVELAFQPKYGNVAAYQWFAEGYVLVGFSTGYMIVMSTNPNDLGHEIFSTKNHKGFLSNVAVSNVLNKAASCGDSTIKVHELSDLRDVYAVETIDDVSPVDRLQWSDDGQFLTVSTKDGSLYSYLARMPLLGSTYGSLVAYLSGLREITIQDQSADDVAHPALTRKALEFEPTLVALGETHIGVVVKNSASFHRFTLPSADGTSVATNDSAVTTKDYTDPIKSLCMNAYFAAAVLESGLLQIHAIGDAALNGGAPVTTSRSSLRDITNAARGAGGGGPTQAQAPRGKTDPHPSSTDALEKQFPEHGNEGRTKTNKVEITCAALSPECIIFGTARGAIQYYLLDGWTVVAELKHKHRIQSLFPQTRGGTKVVFIDAQNDGFLTDPSSDTVMAIPRWSANTHGVLWETDPALGRSIFSSYDDAFITTYVFQPFTVKGPVCMALGVTKLPFGQKPVLVINGVVTCQTLAGRLTTIRLVPYEAPLPDAFLKDKRDEQEQGKGLQLYYMLGMMTNIWALVGTVKSSKAWVMLAESALRMLDLPTAKRIYRQVLQDAGMVWSLDRLDTVEEKNLLAGHISALFGDVSVAQDYFLKSTYPKAALDLRRNLKHWEQALGLATTLAPELITLIAKEYAQQLEMNGQYAEALAMYEKALATCDEQPPNGVVELPPQARDDHRIVCSVGLARMTLRMGDVSRGMKMLAGTTDKLLLEECGAILEALRQYPESATCYERGGFWEKAADVWIKVKNWNKLSSILDRVTSPKLFIQYAKAREESADYTEAARAYEKAKDYDNVVRLFIDHLQNIEGAVAIVRKTRSRESAKLVAKVFQSMRDYRSVVEFYLMAGMREEAFELAQQRDVMEQFADLVKEDATPDELLNIAAYLENKSQHLLAGQYLLQAGEYPRALRMFLRSASEPGAIDNAIETVGIAKSDALTHQLIDFLMGETDGVPKDAKYIFKLYMSLGQYREAARTAIIIAREEQALGNYRAAHDLLLDNYKQLRATKNHVPAEIERMLMLLHSYMLVKALVRINEHERGARMLMRVANNISKFPSHIVPILTSTVIECYRAGFKRAAFEYGAMLMRPEHRNKIDAKYKSRIEKIVRRPETDEIEEPTSPCPFCGNLVANTTLDCIECKNHAPYCIATGQHMTLTDWSKCPSCSFPALYTPFCEFLTKQPSCPMCSAEIHASQLVLYKESEASAMLYHHSNKQQRESSDSKENVEKVSSSSAASPEQAAGGGASEDTDAGSGQLNKAKSRSFVRRSKESVRIVQGGSTGEVGPDTGGEVKGL